jgi:hypothetical protein
MKTAPASASARLTGPERMAAGAERADADQDHVAEAADQHDPRDVPAHRPLPEHERGLAADRQQQAAVQDETLERARHP